jgi:predicted MFS family arabinose efflux permease
MTTAAQAAQVGRSTDPEPRHDELPPAQALVAALALALAAAVSLGLARFAYALLLTPMRDDLGWSYLTAGAMNTANATGYLLGALSLPWLLRRFDARALMLWGGAAAGLLLALHGAARGDALLMTLRLLSGAASAFSFACGGVLAARLAGRLQQRPQEGSSAVSQGQRSAAPWRSSAGAWLTPGHVLGLYYGGTGLGIMASALVVPPLPWPGAWLALGMLALAATALTAAGTGALHAPPTPGAARQPARHAAFAWALGGYLMFGLGYIGYMTFIITLLREQGLGTGLLVAFFLLLGAGVVASSWLWAGLLQRWRGGGTLALLNLLLALATVLPVLSVHPAVVFASGALFGSVFLALVASTTALVRHNLPPAAWPAGIAAFTAVFAAGQIVGPSLVGWVADGPGGLLRGFAVSAGLLALGALLASRQRPLR